MLEMFGLRENVSVEQILPAQPRSSREERPNRQQPQALPRTADGALAECWRGLGWQPRSSANSPDHHGGARPLVAGDPNRTEPSSWSLPDEEGFVVSEYFTVSELAELAELLRCTPNAVHKQRYRGQISSASRAATYPVSLPRGVMECAPRSLCTFELRSSARGRRR